MIQIEGRNMKTIDEYIETFEPNIKKTLNEIRNFIKSNVPEATEKISYGMPTFYLHGNLIHFAAFKDHYSIFPSPSGIEAFKKELAPYRTGKGTLSFPIGKPIPWKIIQRVIQFRIIENKEKMENKKLKNKSKPKIFSTSFASVYPLYIQKAEKKGRTKKEVDTVIYWLTGYNQKTLQRQIKNEIDFETFFAQSPQINPNASKITGKICGYQVEEIEDKLIQKIRWLDKLIDELTKGKPLDKILRE